MLIRIHVRNFAIIDELELEFAGGLTVLTGETGAGKSILIDALGLVLGNRGDKSAVAEGAERAEISAEFDIAEYPHAQSWLETQELDAGDECVLRRVIGADGRSRAFINANSVSLQNLKQLGQLLVEIHGQHAHQTLTRSSTQRALVDHHGGNGDFLDATAEAWVQWRQATEQLEKLLEQRDERASRLDFLTYQVNELEEISDDAQQFEALNSERDRLANSHRLAEATGSALAEIFDNEAGNAHATIADAVREVERAAQLDPALAAGLSMLEEAQVNINEAANELRRYAATLEANPDRRDELESRVANLQNIARKHRADIAQLPGTLVQLQAELDALQNSETEITGLSAIASEARSAYNERATRLSAARLKASSSFAGAVTETMQRLGMEGGKFGVDIQSDPDKPRSDGVDTTVFNVSANPGQSLQPLAKVASGGELSRISLAVQVIATNVAATPTVIFDEVDSGVGGGVAEIVGRLLRELGNVRQVLCVTHLPQVASQGHHHLRVSKITDGRSTRTTMADLSRDERIEEIARMLGGVKITKRTRDHATEMLTGTQTPKRQRA